MTANGQVDVFVGGVQKGGTTTLFTYLARHPQLIVPRMKETHFFDDELRYWQNPDYSDLHGCFAADRADGLRFEATPIYYFWAPALDRILRYNPDARFVLLFRDPVQRAISHWRMERALGAESLSFGEAVHAEAERLAAAPMWSADWRHWSYVARGRYGECLARLLSRFPRSQVLMLRSEDLFAHHQQVLARIAVFLGLEPFPPLGPSHAFGSIATAPVPQDDCAYVRRRLRDDMVCFAALSGLDISSWSDLPTEPARPLAEGCGPSGDAACCPAAKP